MFLSIDCLLRSSDSLLRLSKDSLARGGLSALEGLGIPPRLLLPLLAPSGTAILLGTTSRVGAIF